MSVEQKIAADLHRIGAVQIKTDHSFTWTSGIKSPIYCDNRLTMSYPDIREKIADAFVTMIKQLDEKPDVIAGCATAGIPHAAWVAQKLHLPMVYVRSSAKAHGKKNQIEGAITKGQKSIVIEDLISTGGSSIKVADALQQEKAEVLGVFAIFSYGLPKTKTSFNEEGYRVQTITDFDRLIEVLVENQTISLKEKNDLISWRDQLVL
ncbi:orotate phosphoribosyltransferase [Aquibacillus sp. 3ASR75-11]|uniref:Orotate phosphoribosyltransferase n=1 Tax=Terrihalobacillus insolitus TaxID=2950438 RepID=A0A9X3WPR9_9BACI|nr:orotate phosphoribosyltransferase [Terrihalobacillus insolitus]MDC3412862.1 orotate phosphoribosyltransferase [Terrihalobacillus insolitus]MDC3423662.1 orotate phosphoribosyltransferase [Terrihalobacillus insolitus]